MIRPPVSIQPPFDQQKQPQQQTYVQSAKVFSFLYLSLSFRISSSLFNDQRNMDNKYGLLGLLDVIRMTNHDLNELALGTDLTTLGLNLTSPVYVFCFPPINTITQILIPSFLQLFV